MSDFVFCLAFALWITLMVLNSSFFARYLQGMPFMGIRAFCILLLALSELTGTDRPTRWATGLFAAGLWGFAIMTSHESILLDNLAFIFCARGRDFRSIARLSLVLTSGLVCLIIICSLLGVIQNYSAWSGGRMRSYLGFLYALFPSQYLYLITCLAIYLLGRELRFRHFAILWAVNLFVYVYTDSRLSFSFAIGLLIIAALIARHQRLNPSVESCLATPMKLFAALSFVLSAGISVGLTALYNSGTEWMARLDNVELLGGRLSIGQRALQNYGIHPFGRELHFTGAALSPTGISGSLEFYDTIDCLYVRMLVNYGLILTVLFIALFTVVTIRALRQRNDYLTIILVTIAFRGMIDNLTLHLQYDTFLLLIGMLMTSPRISLATRHLAQGQWRTELEASTNATHAQRQDEGKKAPEAQNKPAPRTGNGDEDEMDYVLPEGASTPFVYVPVSREQAHRQTKHRRKAEPSTPAPNNVTGNQETGGDKEQVDYLPAPDDESSRGQTDVTSKPSPTTKEHTNNGSTVLLGRPKEAPAVYIPRSKKKSRRHPWAR